MRHLARATALTLAALLLLAASSAPSRGGEPIQAHVRPVYAADGVSLIGIEVDQLAPDSLFARIGLHNGDVIVGFNGVRIHGKDQAAAMLRGMSTASVVTLRVLDPSGRERSIEVSKRGR